MSIKSVIGAALLVSCTALVVGCSGYEPIPYPQPASERPAGEGIVSKAFDAYVDERIEKANN